MILYCEIPCVYIYIYTRKLLATICCNVNDLNNINFVLSLYFLNKCTVYGIYIIREYEFSLLSSSRLSSRSSIPLIQNVPSSVRTAKAERRLKERLIQQVLYFNIFIYLLFYYILILYIY